MNLVTPKGAAKHELLFNKLWQVCWTKAHGWLQLLGVTKFIIVTVMIWVTLCCATWLVSWAWGQVFVQKFMHSSNSRCDQIYSNERYDFGHTLLCYSSQTWLFNKPIPEAGLLNKGLMLSSCFRCDQIYKYDIYDFGHTLLCYLSRTWLFNKPIPVCWTKIKAH